MYLIIYILLLLLLSDLGISTWVILEAFLPVETFIIGYTLYIYIYTLYS